MDYGCLRSADILFIDIKLARMDLTCVVRLRLQRQGNKKRPFYRIIAADQRAPRDGRFIEILGTYNSINIKSGDVSLKEDRVKYWLGKGAQPSRTVASILKNKGLTAAAK